MKEFSKTVMKFKEGDYITFNNDQEWEEVLKGLLEIGEEVYKGYCLWDAYDNSYRAYAYCEVDKDWSRVVLICDYKRDITQAFKRLLQVNSMEKFLQEATSAMNEAALSITNTNAKGDSLRAVVGSLRDSQTDLPDSNYYLIDGEKHWNGRGSPEVGMKVLMSGNVQWEAFDVTIEDVLKDALTGCTVYKGSFVTQEGYNETLSWNTQDWEVGVTEAVYNKHQAMEEIKDCLGELLRKLESF